MVEESNQPFVERRQGDRPKPPGIPERRQFVDSREGLPEDVRELAQAIDAYKLRHHRRFITLSEVLEVVKSLGYHKDG